MNGSMTFTSSKGVYVWTYLCVYHHQYVHHGACWGKVTQTPRFLHTILVNIPNVSITFTSSKGVLVWICLCVSVHASVGNLSVAYCFMKNYNWITTQTDTMAQSDIKPCFFKAIKNNVSKENIYIFPRTVHILRPVLIRIGLKDGLKCSIWFKKILTENE